MCFGLCGLYYAIKLGRLIYTLRSYKLKKADFDAGKTVSQKQKALNKLRRVQRTVIVLTFMAILAIAIYGFRAFGIDVCCDPDQTYANFGYLIFISVVHVGECINKQLLNTIKTVDYKRNNFTSWAVITIPKRAINHLIATDTPTSQTICCWNQTATPSLVQQM